MYAMWLFDTDWKAEIFKRLDAIADKLGVAAAHLWAVLVRQGMAEAIGCLVLAVCCLIGIIASVKAFKWSRKTGEATRTDYVSGEWGGQYIAWCILSAVTFILSVTCFLVNIYEFTIWAVNPEYFALQRIMELLK